LCNNITSAARLDKATGSQPGGDLLKGPRLDGDDGHTSQQDTDLMFA